MRLRPHLLYGSYVAKHKWFVFRAGLKTKAPLWRLLIHDWSKLSRTEWGPYVRRFYGGRGGVPVSPADPEEFRRAWLHHQHANPHHWQHWVLREDTGGTKLLEMPAHFVREMVADWMGANRAITGRWGVRDWYPLNRDQILLAPQTRHLVENLLELYA